MVEEGIVKFVAHSKTVLRIAQKHGWLPGARYTNLRDVRHVDRLGFLDINWKDYNFAKHLAAARSTNPIMTVARDIEAIADLDEILDEARRLGEHAARVIVVPKDPLLTERLTELIPKEFTLGFSVPSRYGRTPIPPASFAGQVHLLGGRPDVQRRLAEQMNVLSLDCNRFTLDAAFGDYFDGATFRRHPLGGYERCLEDSIVKINELWTGYRGQGRRPEWTQNNLAA